MKGHTQKTRLYLLLSLTIGLALVTIISPWSAAAAIVPTGDDAPDSRSAGYDLRWWSVAGAGYSSGSAEGFRLSGIAGQPDAAVLTDGGYVLAGGFWPGGMLASRYRLYLPLIVRNS
jgi:hypothetical protein